MMEPYWPDFNDLWDYNDPAGTEVTFREKLPNARREAALSAEAKSRNAKCMRCLMQTLTFA